MIVAPIHEGLSASIPGIPFDKLAQWKDETDWTLLKLDPEILQFKQLRA